MRITLVLEKYFGLFVFISEIFYDFALIVVLLEWILDLVERGL